MRNSMSCVYLQGNLALLDHSGDTPCLRQAPIALAARECACSGALRRPLHRRNRQAEQSRRRLSRAGKLTSLLGVEADRWAAEAEELGSRLARLPGDALLAAACIAYTGPLTGVRRDGGAPCVMRSFVCKSNAGVSARHSSAQLVANAIPGTPR